MHGQTTSPLHGPTSTRTFVFGLWGNHSFDGWATKVVEELRRGAPVARRLNAVVYVIGQDALRIVLAAPELRDNQVRCLSDRGGHWINKIRILQDALKHYNEVIWSDWDVRQLRAVDEHFWQVLSERAPIQMTMRQFRRRQCSWRNKDQRAFPAATQLYLRDPMIADCALHYQTETNCYNDETAWAFAIDRLNEGWMGLDTWQQHFEYPWYRQRKQMYPAIIPYFEGQIQATVPSLDDELVEKTGR